MRILLSVMAVLLTSFSVHASCIEGNCYDGRGTFVYKSGAKYVGEFQDGKISGQGALFFSSKSKYARYFGNWSNNYREGEGRMIYKSGHEYQGNFHKGKQSGQGTMSYANGDKYSGNWEEDEPNGYGTYHFKGGDWYEGNFLSGKYHGQGTMNYVDGAKFVGQWKDNKKHGSGILYAANGSTNNGEWAFGKLVENIENQGSIAFSDTGANNDYSSVERDCTNEHCESGRGFFNYSDGTRYVGEFVGGNPEGKGTVVYANGDRYEGGWKKHAPHGEGVMNYANGRRVGATWEYGKPVSFLESEETEIAKTDIQMEVDQEVKIWAVVVGVGRYAHMPALKYTDDDAYQIYAFLKSPEGGALPDRQVEVLVDEDATRANILRAARKVMLKADQNDVVMFYFSGHGLEGSFLPVDYDGFSNRVKHSEIRDLLKQSKAKHKIVFADACHSGSLLAMKKPLHQTLSTYYTAFEKSKGGTALLMSSKSEEYSLEDGGLRSGIFSHFLIRGLKGEADVNRNKIITIDELYNFVYDEVRSYTGNIQTPTLTGDYDHAMPVAVMRR